MKPRTKRNLAYAAAGFFALGVAHHAFYGLPNHLLEYRSADLEYTVASQYAPERKEVAQLKLESEKHHLAMQGTGLLASILFCAYFGFVGRKTALSLDTTVDAELSKQE